MIYYNYVNNNGGGNLILNLQVILVLLFITSLFGYIAVVLKEKINLKNNVVVIDNKHVTQDHLNETDLKEFILDGLRVKAGDEIKVITTENKRINGILIGAKKIEKEILIITHRDEIKRFTIDSIARLKIVSKYGRFFT